MCKAMEYVKDGNFPPCTYNGRPYTPIKPVADNFELCDAGDRLMLIHSRYTDQPKFEVALKGALSSGWAVGIF